MSSGVDPDGEPINRFELTATIVQRDVVRYTPSGIPTIDCVLAHQSVENEAGHVREVALELPAVAFERLVQRLVDCPLEGSYRFTGFLANRSRKSKRAVFHITAFTNTED